MKLSSNQKKYNSKNLIKQILIQRFLKNIKNIITRLGVKIILEAGCGEGYIICYLKKHLPPVTRIRGFDISKKSLKIALDKLKDDVLFWGDIYNIPAKNKSVDLIMAIEVLEHLKNPDIALRELRRVTKKYCLISVPLEPFFSIGNLLCTQNIKKLGRDPGHINFWGRKKIISLINKYFFIKSVKISFPWIIVLAEK